MRPLWLRVAYKELCHLVHAQGIQQQPRRLNSSIPNLQLTVLLESSWCCGSAGTYNLTHVKESEALLLRKMKHVSRLKIDKLVTANSGCYIQLSKGVREARIDVEVMHICELLALAYG